MPLRRDKPYCINHRTTPLVQSGDEAQVSWVSALTSLFTAGVSRKAPVNIFVCPRCGYVEMYATAFGEYLPMASTHVPKSLRTSERPSFLSALNFEASVVDAISRQEPPFIDAKVVPDVHVEVGDRIYEIDAVVEMPNKLYVVEVKSAISESIVHDAIHAAMDRARAYSASSHAEGRTAHALVVVPPGAQRPKQRHRVPILHFDQRDGIFLDDLSERDTAAG